MSKTTLTEMLSLDGLIHLWGDAGSGKTLFACAMAAEDSRYSKVEWINTDSKQSFIPKLIRSVKVAGGSITNVAVTMTSDRTELRDLILGLSRAKQPGVGLIVIDSITRLLDMARDDPTMWGRELFEDALPTLAGIVDEKGIKIIITSESRAMNDSGNIAVHHRSIKKWVDHDILLVRNTLEESTRIMRVLDTPEDQEQIGILRLMDGGVPLVQPQSSRISQPVGGQG
ncbi:MAG: AAA family ATPase [Candidatus Thorarchaeota archaeon]